MNFFTNRRVEPARYRSNTAIAVANTRYIGRLMRLLPAASSVLLLALTTAPRSAACACGCGIYEVGTANMIPTGPGIETFFDYDYQDQNQDWSGGSLAPAADNGDKDIRTSWYNFGYQEMFNRDWGIRVEIPYEDRHFVTTGGATGDDIVTVNFSGLGDIRIEAIYTGFSPDLSSGLMFGLKVPTGSYTNNDAYDDVDRDSQIGTGSTDILLGGYKRFDIGSGSDWSGFTQALFDIPVLTQVQYRPGTEFDASIGAYYNGLKIGRLKIAPIAQLKVSLRTEDSGINSAQPVASGFERLLAAPGLEFDMHPFKVYSDVELPIYYHMTGDQLVARSLFRVNISYMF
jgi:hypothetical protein